MMEQIPEPAILSTAYLPNIQYISKLLLHQKVIIDIHETYLKQSYRNRCHILGANGILPMSIPVIKTNGNHTKVKDIQIDNTANWAHVHWGAIFSAYGNSPFFEIFEEEIIHLYKKKYKFLIDFNAAAIHQLFESLGVSVELSHSDCFFETSDYLFDYRNSIHPKPQYNLEDHSFSQKKYFQVFGEKHGFKPNLSIIDLLFNEGSQALYICKQCIISP